MKYANQTIIEIAQRRGSAAKTKAGAWKYLLANLPHANQTRSSCKWDWDRWTELRRNRTADGRAKVLGYDLNDPNTPGRIMDDAMGMNRKWDADCRIAIERDQYGAIYRNTNATAAKRPRAEVTGWYAAWALLKDAEKKSITPDEYDTIEFDRKGRADGEACHHELYDFAKNAAIICIRRTEGTRYGVHTKSKTYMLVESYRRKITAHEITIPVAKYAKMGILHYGDIVAIAQGKKKIKLINATHQVRRGYKAVRITEHGYESVWDGSKWEIGVTRIEKAQSDHSGGLYYYTNMESLKNAAKENSIFAPDMQHHNLAILEVEASGVHISYGEKLAATKITPIKQVATI